MGKNFNHEKVLAELIKGRRPAFEKLFHLYYPRLKRYARYFLKNPDEAEDIVQDVFLKIWENRHSLRSDEQFASLVFTMLKNRCLNTLKRKVVQEKFTVSQAKIDTEELYHISFEVEGEFVSMEERLNLELEKIISGMPDRCQKAFRLKWTEGKKIREIAEIMGVSTTMVDKHLAKGLQIARSHLAPDLFLFFFLTRG
jgi:RNA polymerase sigma-70 factor (family 1)